MNELEKYWLNVCVEAYLKEPAGYIQIRKLHSFQSMIIPGKVWKQGIKMKFSDMGYGEKSSKMSQLMRNYYNDDEITKANQKFRDRLSSKGNQSKQSCITAKMGAAAKRDESQGFCIQCVTINYCNEKLYIDLYYRTTELTQKFLADLKFLHEKVLPAMLEEVDLEIEAVRFHFSTAYVSLMFLPVVLQHIDVLEFLQELIKRDPKYARQVISAMVRFMKPENTYNYRSRSLMHDFFRDKVYTRFSKPQIQQINQLVKSQREDHA